MSAWPRKKNFLSPVCAFSQKLSWHPRSTALPLTARSAWGTLETAPVTKHCHLHAVQLPFATQHIFAVHLVLHHVTRRLTFRNFGTIALANGSPLSFPQKTQASLLTLLLPWHPLLSTTMSHKCLLRRHRSMFMHSLRPKLSPSRSFPNLLLHLFSSNWVLRWMLNWQELLLLSPGSVLLKTSA